ncbi:helix-turn-helix domain-containing protein [Homoserinimonas hongtaonis]|uniref:helix-turn-helix domain-containing protein n=1 Tax=Homoserinimonas hongtaonis TaxID=2079791 RepID=UPI000D35C228|nr:helix-turn-helix domain-containing protein [Salinibacterium hongtaonis]AWB90304.1 DNA-binding protein [Salinibacterium hongtaonis]
MVIHNLPALDLLDVQGIASYLNITPRTARRIVSERRVPVTKIGALVRVRRTDLDAYLVAHTVEAVSR